MESGACQLLNEMSAITPFATLNNKTSVRPSRPNYALLHSKPLPLDIYPLPAFLPQNPLSILRVAYVILSQFLKPPPSHSVPLIAYYSHYTHTINVTNPDAIRTLWERGFFGKGSLSRSEPEWLDRERRRRGLIDASAAETSAEVTKKRREERRLGKRERARKEREVLEEQLRKEGKLVQVFEVEPSKFEEEEKVEELLAEHSGLPEPETTTGRVLENGTAESADAQTAATTKNSTDFVNQEHLQLANVETFFLCYGLGMLTVVDPETNNPYTTSELFSLLRQTSYFPPRREAHASQPDDPFLLNYVVYHHFRSLGWVVRPGVKFAVDFLLYNRGPVFSHAEFAILILPSYGHDYYSATEDRRAEKSRKESRMWWWLHSANRVQSQVRKSLVLVYVEIPPPSLQAEAELDIGRILQSYRIQEFCLKRWTANRNRD